MDMEEADEEGTVIVCDIVHVLMGSKLICVYVFAATILFLWYAYLGGVIVF